MIQFAIAVPCDQTFFLWSDEGLSTKFSDAKLYKSKDEALEQAVKLECAGPNENYFEILDVIDESEFRSRPDTW